MIKQNFTEIDDGVKDYFKNLKSFKNEQIYKLLLLFLKFVAN